MEHAWKACIGNPYRGFESLPLRHSYKKGSPSVGLFYNYRAAGGFDSTLPPSTIKNMIANSGRTITFLIPCGANALAMKEQSTISRTVTLAITPP
jgi:hypothetical protein